MKPECCQRLNPEDPKHQSCCCRLHHRVRWPLHTACLPWTKASKLCPRSSDFKEAHGAPASTLQRLYPFYAETTLLAIQLSLSGQRLQGWSSGSNYCTGWQGVTCQDNRVTNLYAWGLNHQKSCYHQAC